MDDQTVKLKEEIVELKKEIAELKDRVHLEAYSYLYMDRHLGGQISALQAENKMMLEMLRKYHAPPGHWKEPHVPYSEEDEVQSKFGEITEKIKFWSREFAKDISQFDLQGYDRELFFDEVSKIMILDELDQQEFPKCMQLQPKLLTNVLDALLNRHLFSTLFSDPFFFFGKEISQGLNDILSLGNASLAYRYTRLLLPQNDGVEESEVKLQTNELICRAASRGAIDFMESPAKYIINESPGASEKLERIYILAAEHSSQFWAERAFMRVVDPADTLGQPFTYKGMMETHTSVYSCDDVQNEGQQITMVRSPQIEAYGRLKSHVDKYIQLYTLATFFKLAVVWFYFPRPDQPDYVTKIVQPRFVPPRVETSPGTAGARLLKDSNEPPLLELVKPYLDEFSEQIRPLIEGLRAEIAVLAEENASKSKKNIDEDRREDHEAV